MGKSKVVTKTTRGRQPIEYKLTGSFELEKIEDGSKVAGSMVVPIRKGVGARLAKYKKEDIAVLLRQLADVIEKGDYSMLGSDGAAIDAAMAAMRQQRKTN